MNGDQPQLKHEEVWDDSALIDSWNEALDEYKKYHSIHARGVSIKDLEREVTSKAAAGTEAETRGDDGPEAEQGAGASTQQAASAASAALATPATPAAPAPGSGHGTNATLPVFPPQAVLGTIRDENLKKLLMSWYYAGYYTGLYEGQQQSQQPAAATTQPSSS